MTVVVQLKEFLGVAGGHRGLYVKKRGVARMFSEEWGLLISNPRIAFLPYVEIFYE